MIMKFLKVQSVTTNLNFDKFVAKVKNMFVK